jgi:cytochrome c biogenesis protein CcmG/thiol:disulfide interchange protein DsbE
VTSARRAAQVLALALLSGLLALLVWRLTHEPSHPKFGHRAPGFNLALLNGKGRLSLGTLEGKAVLVNFWSSTCVPCVAESGTLESLYRRDQARGLVVVGIDPEDFKSDARRFIARHHVTFPNVNDVGYRVADRYGVGGTPESFLIDRNGKLVDVLVGPIDAAVNRDRLAAGLKKVLHA